MLCPWYHAQEIHCGYFGEQQGLKAPGMGHRHGAGVGFVLLLALEDLQGGEGSMSPQPPAPLLWRTGADPRSSVALTEDGARGRHRRRMVALDSGDAGRSPFLAGRPKPGLHTVPTERSPRQQGVRP